MGARSRATSVHSPCFHRYFEACFLVQPQFPIQPFGLSLGVFSGNVIEESDRMNLFGLLPVPCGVYERLGGFLVISGLLVFLSGLFPVTGGSLEPFLFDFDTHGSRMVVVVIYSAVPMAMIRYLRFGAP